MIVHQRAVPCSKMTLYTWNHEHLTWKQSPRTRTWRNTAKASLLMPPSLATVPGVRPSWNTTVEQCHGVQQADSEGTKVRGRKTEKLTRFFAVKCAPCFRRSFAMEKWPYLAAQCSGVSPSCKLNAYQYHRCHAWLSWSPWERSRTLTSTVQSSRKAPKLISVSTTCVCP